MTQQKTYLFCTRKEKRKDTKWRDTMEGYNEGI